VTDLLKGAPARILAAILLLQAVAYYAVAARGDIVTEMRPLSAFPPASSGWTAVREFPLENEVQQVLRADDTLNRVYVNPQQTASASLFVAYFKTQRYGQSPHSPKNCLPGAGWTPSQDGQLPVTVPGRANPIVVNRYVIARGDEESMVLYWYQSHGRIIARELAAKVWLVADAVRYHRSDTALVRIIVPVRNGARDAAEQTAIEFVRAVYPDLAGQLPK
jgi:EpsI family protein